MNYCHCFFNNETLIILNLYTQFLNEQKRHFKKGHSMCTKYSQPSFTADVREPKVLISWVQYPSGAYLKYKQYSLEIMYETYFLFDVYSVKRETKIGKSEQFMRVSVKTKVNIETLPRIFMLTITLQKESIIHHADKRMSGFQYILN